MLIPPPLANCSKQDKGKSLQIMKKEGITHDSGLVKTAVQYSADRYGVNQSFVFGILLESFQAG